ncbi:hypothetical protein [Methylorubrum aminovorans]|uniref:hypothetical protein n=1 Tax=Methylorubrum aminovorans TaxID=269069 RepID=UPI003C30BBB5
MSADRIHACPYCPRTLGDASGLYSHVKAKHGARKAYPLRPVSDREPSMAELHVAALEARACDEPVDHAIAEMFDV